MDNDYETLGDCCICGEQSGRVRNIVTLDKRVPEGETRGGWGCVVCKLEPFGAVAVLCDGCVDDYQAKKAEIKFACLGYPGENRRIEVEKLTEIWGHDKEQHPETWNWEKALNHFLEIRRHYQDCISEPGANTSIALEHWFKPLAKRFYLGERTKELYDQMMKVE